LNDATAAFLRKTYKEFYFRRADSISFPNEISSREFGYIPFAGGMIRHLAFRNPGEAMAEILRQAPSSVYCSNARYSNPALPMEEKGWLGAELIFDIDATDIPTSCKRSHDVWYCEFCKKPVQLLHGTCKACLDAAMQHAARVVDFLTHDFGVPADEIRTYFSGSRGYHLHIFDARFELLDQQARAEIADYIRGSGLPASNTIWASMKHMRGSSPDMLRGWTKRIVLAVGYEPGQVPQHRRSVAQAIASQAARIDPSVTTDIHRVFRLAGTLHGNTGMLKMEVPPSGVFDPTSDPVVLTDDNVTINVSFYPKFTIKGQTFGPYKSEVVSIPSYAAVSILTRGFAEVA
jgi:DNA primase small subunit